MSLLVTILVIAAILAANVGLTALVWNNDLFLDLTETKVVSGVRYKTFGLYTLREAMTDVLDDIDDEITIVFCDEPDRLMQSSLSRPVYLMALEMQRKYDNIKVEYINVEDNPTAVQKYKRNSAVEITPSHVVVTHDNDFRLFPVNSFWTYTTENEIYGFDGEYKVAMAILSLTAIEKPSVCFTVGHGERPADPDSPETYAFYDLIINAGFNVKTVDLEREDIPDDCVLLIMNGPTEDYVSENINSVEYVSPIEKIDRFLAKYNSLMYFRDPGTGSLPAIDELMYEWGMTFGDDVISDNTQSLSVSTPVGDGSVLLRDSLIATYSDDTFGLSLYDEIAGLASPPNTIVEHAGAITNHWPENSHYSNGVGRKLAPVLLSGENSKLYNENGDITDGEGSYMTAAITYEVKSRNNVDYYAYVFGASTTELVSSDYLAGNTYANYDIVYAAVRALARVTYASSETIESDLEFKHFRGDHFVERSTEATIYRLKKVTTTDADGNEIKTYKSYPAVTLTIIEESAKLKWSIFIIALPVVTFAVLGTVVRIKRKNK